MIGSKRHTIARTYTVHTRNTSPTILRLRETPVRLLGHRAALTALPRPRADAVRARPVPAPGRAGTRDGRVLSSGPCLNGGAARRGAAGSGWAGRTATTDTVSVAYDATVWPRTQRRI